MSRGTGQRSARRPMERRYGWRDIAALLGVYALVLQIGLGVVAGLASESIASERRAAGDSIADLALQICSPSGLLDLARDGVDRETPRRDGPVCPACLVGHAGPIPPSATVAALPEPVRVEPPLPAADRDRPAPLDLISALNPRAPPTLSA